MSNEQLKSEASRQFRIMRLNQSLTVFSRRLRELYQQPTTEAILWQISFCERKAGEAERAIHELMPTSNIRPIGEQL